MGMNLRAVGLCYLERGCSRGMAPSNMRGSWTYPGVSRGMSCEDPNLYPIPTLGLGPLWALEQVSGCSGACPVSEHQIWRDLMPQSTGTQNIMTFFELCAWETHLKVCITTATPEHEGLPQTTASTLAAKHGVGIGLSVSHNSSMALFKLALRNTN